MDEIKEEQDTLDDEFTLEEIETFERQDEEDALIKVFKDVRQKSRQGLLTRPSDWVELDLTPPHMDVEEFERYVYAYLEEYLRQKESEAVAEPVEVFRTASTVVGVSQVFLAAEAEQKSESESESERSDSRDDREKTSYIQEREGDVSSGKDSVSQPIFDEHTVPPGFELVEIEGELTLLPLGEEASKSYSDCCGITVLAGKKSSYLYDKEIMTDAYARWAFLALEDDSIATFVECVRCESRIYPRPMPATSLMNEPFFFSADEINRIWQVVFGSQEYPDIQRTIASNGVPYFFSTDYLSPAYAASLAEWEAVERKCYL